MKTAQFLDSDYPGDHEEEQSVEDYSEYVRGENKESISRDVAFLRTSHSKMLPARGSLKTSNSFYPILSKEVTNRK